MSERKLTDLLKNGKAWSKLKTTVPGVFVLKLPAYKSAPTRLAVEVNPLDEIGNPKKRRGLVLRSSIELKEFKNLLSHEKIPKLLNMIDSINPKVETKKQAKNEEVIEL